MNQTEYIDELLYAQGEDKDIMDMVDEGTLEVCSLQEAGLECFALDTVNGALNDYYENEV